MVGLYEDPTFFIKGGDVGFADRQKNIFDLLTVAEKEKNERQQDSNIPPSLHLDCDIKPDNRALSRKRTRSEMKQFRGKESIFKKPDVPPPRFKNKDSVPDYQRNPHKWVKYSLGDVSQEDMSDRSNTVAAMAFLRELEERKGGSEKMDIDSVPSQMSFRQPKFKSKFLKQHDSKVSIIDEKTDLGSTSTAEDDDKPSFRSSKVIMPEYVVGVTKKKGKKKSEKIVNSECGTSKITLGHLIEEEEDVD